MTDAVVTPANLFSTNKRMIDIYLVSCVGEKHDRAMPAKDLYASQWFRKAREYVERRGGIWYILSAKHGLISADQVIEPYEQTLNRMPIAGRRHWAQRVREQLDVQLWGRPESGSVAERSMRRAHRQPVSRVPDGLPHRPLHG